MHGAIKERGDYKMATEKIKIFSEENALKNSNEFKTNTDGQDKKVVEDTLKEVGVKMTRGIIYTRPTGGEYAFSKIDGYAIGNLTSEQEQDMQGCWWAVEVDDYENTLRTLRKTLAPMQIDGFPKEYLIHPQSAKDLLRTIKGTPVAPENDIHCSEAFEGSECVGLASTEKTIDCEEYDQGMTLENILKEKDRIIERIKELEHKAATFERNFDYARKAEVLEIIDYEQSLFMELEFQQHCLEE